MGSSPTSIPKGLLKVVLQRQRDNMEVYFPFCAVLSIMYKTVDMGPFEGLLKKKKSC